MNVNDIKDDVIPTPTEDRDMLDLIFERQHALSQKYIPVEKANGLLQTELFPGDLDDRFSQSRMKDFAWRVQEELYEALDALIIHKDNHVHFIEEMIDALHFYTELCLFCGYTSKDVKEFFAIPQGDDNNKPLDKFEALYQIAKAIDQKSGGVDINIPPALLISVTIGQPIQAGDSYVDGNRIGDVDNVVMKERKSMSQDGIVIVTLTIKDNKLITIPNVTTRGFILVNDNIQLVHDLQNKSKQIIEEKLKGHNNELKSVIISELLPYIYEKTGRKPTILPIIMEIKEA